MQRIVPKRIVAAVKKVGWGRLKRYVDNTLVLTGAGAAVFMDPARSGQGLREKTSDALQRYAVGLDGSVNGDALFNNYAGVATRLFDDHVLSRIGHYRRVSGRKLFPMVSELLAPLFAWDAMGAAGPSAQEKLSAAHSCYVETISGLEPVTNEYLGLASNKFKAKLVASYLGNGISHVASTMAPKVNEFLSKATGGFIKGF